MKRSIFWDYFILFLEFNMYICKKTAFWTVFSLNSIFITKINLLFRHCIYA